MIEKLINDPKCAVFCSHSGGKDSQAMYIFLSKVVPSHRLFVIHAHLGKIEWPGTIEHIQDTVEHPLSIVSAKRSFFDRVEHRQEFPSPAMRWCTSDLKREPIRKEIRRICNENGFDKVLDCMGLRAQESPARSKKEPFKRLDSQCNSKREWWQWLPIHDWLTDGVFSYIENNGQKWHYAYDLGMTRLSCRICIMQSDADLVVSAQENPELLEMYSDWEEKIGRTFMMPRKDGNGVVRPMTLKEIIVQHHIKMDAVGQGSTP